jgi:carboxylesterase type B
MASCQNVNLSGGYAIGQIYDQFYTPDQLVKDSKASGTPVIYVAMNYRLGSG